jgi:hypothetical protein
LSVLLRDGEFFLGRLFRTFGRGAGFTSGTSDVARRRRLRASSRQCDAVITLIMNVAAFSWSPSAILLAPNANPTASATELYSVNPCARFEKFTMS